MNIEKAMLKNEHKGKMSQTQCRNVSQQSCKRRRRVRERAGVREGETGQECSHVLGCTPVPRTGVFRPTCRPPD